jgi:hypothetical protein
MKNDKFIMPKGRTTIRAGSSTDIRDGRANRRIRPWTFESKPGSTAAKLEAAVLGAFNAVDSVTMRKTASALSGKFTADGVRDDVLGFALNNAVPAFKRGRDAIAAARREAAALREKTKLQNIDTSDQWRCGLMLRQLDAFRAMTQKERDELTRSPEKLDPILADAILSAPASLSGVSPTHRQQLIDRALQAQHGDALAELQELESAIEAAESVVETARDEIRLEAGVMDPHKFDELAAPIEQKTNAPWLKKFSENGKEVIRKMDWDYQKETGSWPLATPADLENGVFCKTWDEYNQVTNRAA